MGEFFTLLTVFLLGLAVGHKWGAYEAYTHIEKFLDAEQAHGPSK